MKKHMYLHLISKEYTCMSDPKVVYIDGEEVKFYNYEDEEIQEYIADLEDSAPYEEE